MLLFAIPAVSSAQAIFQATISGTEFCHSQINKFKNTVFITFTLDHMLIAADSQFQNGIAAMKQFNDFSTSTKAGAFAFTQDDEDGFGAFTGAFTNNSMGQVGGFTGTLTEIFADGCFETVTIKAKALK
jgi:hypothetical protein